MLIKPTPSPDLASYRQTERLNRRLAISIMIYECSTYIYSWCLLRSKSMLRTNYESVTEEKLMLMEQKSWLMNE